MKQKDVKLGGVYRAKVTNKQVDVRIDAERHTGGWDATNLATNKKVVIKTAQRLTEKKSAKSSKAPHGTKVTTTGNVTVVETVPATVETISGAADANVVSNEAPAADKRVAKKFRKQPKSDEASKVKKMSCIDAAIKVLEESSQPMNAKDMIEAMEAKGYWSSPGGKTPHATLYSAILRELAKGDHSRFAKADRGHFTTNSAE